MRSLPHLRTPRQTKYRAKPTVAHGIRFASKKEADRYCELKLLEQHDIIRDLRIQVPFIWTVTHSAGDKSLTEKRRYVADFSYFDVRAQTTCVEDVKGYLTKEYKQKRNIVKAIFGITIIET